MIWLPLSLPFIINRKKFQFRKVLLLYLGNLPVLGLRKRLFKAKVKLTHTVGPTMCADKSWTIWHPISTVCKRVWLTWSHKICILVSVKHFSPTNVCVMTFTETDLSQASKLSRSWTSTQEAVNMAAPCWKLLWGWYVSGFKLVEDQEWAKICVKSTIDA